MKDNSILITGGAGYIGSHLLFSLLRKKYKVVVLDNLSTGNKKFIPKNIKLIKVDLLDKQKLKQKLNKINFSTIIHLAANIDVIESAKSPKKYLVDNLTMTQNIIEVAELKKVKNFIFSSTAAVYGDSTNVKVSEKTPPRPTSNYGLGKLFCENLVMQYCAEKKINFIILRYFNVVGAEVQSKIGQLKKGSLFKNIASSIVNKKFSLNIYGTNHPTKDGSAIRDYIDVRDLALIHIHVIKKIKKINNLILNCGYKKPYTVLEIVENFSRLINKKIKLIKRKKRLGDISKIYSDNSKLIKNYPDWKQMYDLKSSVESSLEWESYLKK